MFHPIRALVAVGGLFLVALAAGCGSGSEVSEGSCSACGSTSFSPEQCAAFGEAQGCESATFVPTGAGGCNNSCSFKNCDEPPMCGGSALGPSRPQDAAVDAMVDPRCERSDDGLFTADPPCDDADEFNLNGVRYYYCPCAGGCPCGYECGSIPLSVGGTIGSACAPRD